MGLCWSEPPVQPSPVTTVAPVYPQQPQQLQQISYTTNPAIQIQVRTLTGMTYSMWCYPSQTIYQLKLQLQSMTNLPPLRQVLLYMGRQLEDNYCLYQYQIQAGSTLHLVVRLV